MTTFNHHVRLNGKHRRSGKPQTVILAIRDGRIVGRLVGASLTPTQIVEFCSREFFGKPVVSAEMPTWML